jgi:hypothetical protein
LAEATTHLSVGSPSISISEAEVPGREERGMVFAKSQILPLTFHVVSGWSRTLVEKMITVSFTCNTRLKAEE